VFNLSTVGRCPTRACCCWERRDLEGAPPFPAVGKGGDFDFFALHRPTCRDSFRESREANERQKRMVPSLRDSDLLLPPIPALTCRALACGITPLRHPSARKARAPGTPLRGWIVFDPWGPAAWRSIDKITSAWQQSEGADISAVRWELNGSDYMSPAGAERQPCTPAFGVRGWREPGT